MGDRRNRRIMAEISPEMSTASLLVSVEDLINMAMGPESKNIINFKLLQTVLHILARQMRLLEQKVEIKVTEYITMKDDQGGQEDKGRRSRGTSRDEGRTRDKAASKEEKKALKETTAKEDKKAEKESSKEEKEAIRTAEREKRDIEKALAAEGKEKKKQEKEEKSTSKDRGRVEAEKAKAAKEQEKADKAASKERDKSAKDQEKADKAASKERAKSAKDQEKADKAAAKDKDKAAKDQEKADKAASKDKDKAAKDQEKADKAASKDKEKAAKDQEKADKAAAKEKEQDEKARAKAEKEQEQAKAKDEREKMATTKEQEKAQKLSAKEQEKADKAAAAAAAAAAKGGKGKGKLQIPQKGKGSETSIVVREDERDKEKVLVVEKGPTTRPAAPGGRPNIEVVTRSQFDLLREQVGDLTKKAAPLPMPSMPQNKELLQRLSKGTASLTDMMGAMQVNARVVAAEQAIGRMGGILTQLATAGALPEDIAGQVGAVTNELEAELKGAGLTPGPTPATGASGSGVTVKPSMGVPEDDGRPIHSTRSQASAVSRKSILASKSKYGASSTRPSTISALSAASAFVARVTHPELDEAVRMLKEDMTKNMHAITSKASAAADTAVNLAKSVAEKLDIALKLNGRISTLYSMVQDYAEQLSGFDVGLSTQMQSFSEQMNQMRGDLKAGLQLLESVNNNAETAAVMELTERYEGLVTELDHTLHAHQELTSNQIQLGQDLRGLIAAVEMLREQKADRDEVQDGLRDKADNSRLAGLLTEEEFSKSRLELERRLAVCHEKFSRQDAVWMLAVKDLKDVTDTKADLIQLLGLRDEAQNALQSLHELCQQLALVLGEPKAAILTRKLSRGAACGACQSPALMEPEDADAGLPPLMPAARPRPTGAPAVYEEPCQAEFKLPPPPDNREHICHRWVGGSHTLVAPGVAARAHAQPLDFAGVPTTRFAGYGADGRLYMMEEQLQPCLECNRLYEEAEKEEQLLTLSRIEGQPA